MPACRVDDGQGAVRERRAPPARSTASANTTSSRTTRRRSSALQIAAQWSFPPGDTIVAARLRDSSGNLGAAREIVVRNASSIDATPTPTAPRRVRPTPTAHDHASGGHADRTAPSATEYPSHRHADVDRTARRRTPTPTASPSPSGIRTRRSQLSRRDHRRQSTTDAGGAPMPSDVRSTRTCSATACISSSSARPGGTGGQSARRHLATSACPTSRSSSPAMLGDGSGRRLRRRAAGHRRCSRHGAVRLHRRRRKRRHHQRPRLSRRRRRRVAGGAAVVAGLACTRTGASLRLRLRRPPRRPRSSAC